MDGSVSDDGNSNCAGGVRGFRGACANCNFRRTKGVSGSAEICCAKRGGGER